MASVSAGKEERGAAGDLALSGCEAEQEKGPLRWEFRSRPAVPEAGRRWRRSLRTGQGGGWRTGVLPMAGKQILRQAVLAGG
ncbi:hypothetical protein CXU09_09800 [Akkermansia muciniphila]|uniref:Uncharacterized protein n=1 Tax=Akkermansia muciniphila TaxID=239935 RepID=A0AAP8NKA7_9BACT|nr:hypothetical protein CXU09_09800 [Akkermansia muciniphila]